MSKIDVMKKLTDNNNGYFFISEALEQGISKTYIEEYLKRYEFERVAKGIYMSPDAWLDYLYIIHKKCKNVVFSHETALDIHNLLDKESNGIKLTVAQQYNATNLRKMGCTIYSVKSELLDIGRIKKNTMWGNEVFVYDMDKTICDIINHKSKVSLYDFQYAINEYFKRPDKNITNLMNYAKLLGIKEKVQIYTEVFLR